LFKLSSFVHRQRGGQETIEIEKKVSSSSLLQLKLVNRNHPDRVNIKKTMCKDEKKDCRCCEKAKPLLNAKHTTLLHMNTKRAHEKPCSACTECLDFDPSCHCEECERSRSRRRRLIEETPRRSKKALRYLTLCEVRRHRTAQSAWLIKGRYVYDVTEMVPAHPGGDYSILRHSGGQKLDCTQDFNFHSRKGQKIWDRYKIGILVPCPSDGTRPLCEAPSCSVM
jgi:hypothetical protein